MPVVKVTREPPVAWVQPTDAVSAIPKFRPPSAPSGRASCLLCASFAALVRLNEDEFGLKLTGDSNTEASRQGLSRGVHDALRGE